MEKWTNYFVTSLNARGTEGHIPAETLHDRIKSHDGSEAYHCAFEVLETKIKFEEDTGRVDEKGKKIYAYHAEQLNPAWPKSFNEYDGTCTPSLGYVWFDFDSKPDDGASAFAEAKRFVATLGVHDLFIAFSGSKGFHIGVPFAAFPFQASADLGRKLNAIAFHFKRNGYPSLDTTVYNANRKFRALGSKHPKTGLYKIALTKEIFETYALEEIKDLAKVRRSLEVPIPALRSPLPLFVDICKQLEESKKAPPKKDSKNEKEWIAPTGKAAFEKCGFLKHVKENPAQISEPEWYAALSIVSRFQDGRQQCHSISHGHPGYSATSCNEKIDQALKESAPRTCQNISTISDKCKQCPLFGKINSPVNIFDTRFYIVGGKGKLLPDYNSLLQAFQKKHAFKTIADMKTVYVYNGTHYEEYTPIEIKGFAEEAFEPKPQEKIRAEFTHKVFANSITKRAFFTDTTQDKINFKNGILDLSGDAPKVIAHDAKFGFRGVLPYAYNPEAKCETFDWWIKDVMLGDAQLVAILQEFMGYVIRGGEYKYHKALWLSGSGRNGKSTFLSVLKALIGAGNYSTLSIRQIINDKFSSADLDGKIANFSEETSPEELSDSGPFKNLTGDGELLAQKKYGDPYSFRNRAKLIMTYNEVPMLKDLSPGMLSRPIIIPWKKDLTDSAIQDKNLGKKLMAELPGIFNFALAGWERLEAQGDFTKSEKSQLEMEEIRSSSCSAAQWLYETISFAAEKEWERMERIKPRQLYEAYKQTVGQYAYAEQKFYKRINAIPDVAKRRLRAEKGTEYIGMKFTRQSSQIIEF